MHNTGPKTMNADPLRPLLPPKPAHEAGTRMLITILIIVLIVAIVLWIFGR